MNTQKRFFSSLSLYKVINNYHHITHFLTKIPMSLLMILIRFWVAQIFWYSGLTKIASWQSTVYLFTYEYNVPILPPEIAAYLATTFELICPCLLVLGLFTRLASIPLIIMTIIIQFTYLYLVEHIYWMMLLTTILFYGPSSLSLDNLFMSFLRTRKSRTQGHRQVK